MKTLIVFPLQEELDLFLASCRQKGLSWAQGQIGRLPVFQVPDLGTSLAKGGTGKAQFAVQTQHLLDAGPVWEMVICAGAAGALVDEIAIGDVVVATVTVEHDYRNQFSERPLPNFRGSRQALAALRAVRMENVAYDIHFGPVASGDEDIMAAERRQQLNEQTGGLVAAWEGAGGARACAFSGLPFLEVRGVSDAADASAATAFEENLEKAMSHVADLITAWLAQA
jgi:adenosylhomocysteine nucleosidase